MPCSVCRGRGEAFSFLFRPRRLRNWSKGASPEHMAAKRYILVGVLFYHSPPPPILLYYLRTSRRAHEARKRGRGRGREECHERGVWVREVGGAAVVKWPARRRRECCKVVAVTEEMGINVWQYYVSISALDWAATNNEEGLPRVVVCVCVCVRLCVCSARNLTCWLNY